MKTSTMKPTTEEQIEILKGMISNDMLKKLETIVHYETGFYIPFKIEIETLKNGTVRLNVHSTTNLVSLSGIMQHNFKELSICNFGGGLSVDENNIKFYWLSLHFRYTHKNDGGSNGCDFINIKFKHNNWTRDGLFK